MASPDFGRSVNPISTGGGGGADTPEFSDHPTALSQYTI